AHDGAQSLAEQQKIPLLGGIPLEPRIRQLSDAGTPITATDPDSSQAAHYHAIANNLLLQLNQLPRQVKVEIPVLQQ
ncbi:MAG: P-loop NTPase, partial [Mariprofundales bacterium]